MSRYVGTEHDVVLLSVGSRRDERDLADFASAGRAARRAPLGDLSARARSRHTRTDAARCVAYTNGHWIPASELSIAVDDVGFLLGATVTERLRTFGGQVFRLAEHLQRMRRSLEIVGLDAAAIVDELAQAIPEFVDKNAGQIAADDDWTINAFVTPGVAGSGRPTVCVHGWPLPFHQWAADYDRGISVVVSDVRQVPDNCWPSELKCRSRMHYYLADQQAKAQQPGAARFCSIRTATWPSRRPPMC